MSTVEDIERIVFALDDLVEEIVKRTQTRPAKPGKPTATPFKFRRLDELASREDAEVSEILDDPVGLPAGRRNRNASAIPLLLMAELSL